MGLAEAIRARADRFRVTLAAIGLAARHPGTPFMARVWAFAAVAYALSPVDLVPDFIPVLGYLDDLVIVPLLVWLAVRRIPPPVMAECRAQAAAGLASPLSRRRWIYAIPVVAVWVLLAGVVVLAVWRR